MGPTTLPSPPLLPRTRRRRRVLVRDGGADRPASGRRPSSPSAFLRRRRPLLAAHVVNFLKDRVWEMVERLLISHVAFRMCSGALACPSSLRDFMITASLESPNNAHHCKELRNISWC
ncbi:hypothetical protein GUJ93_ZPchr0009g2081 [Zizania palustris]|uniref:Uncharacterized protein n=1 Tax=Zizania palustris TaxID=103762 RepID=A0A8J5R966_ZIZPA|nr:hypothetical protein GUJ93_ZPchr0009g2081 [Zizania palustris]